MPRSTRMLAASSAVLLVATGVAVAQQLTVDINRISDSGVGEKIGTVVVTEGKGGVSFKIAVTGLPKGQRGFHVHEKGDCGPAMKDGKMTAGLAAAGHLDPEVEEVPQGTKGRRPQRRSAGVERNRKWHQSDRDRSAPETVGRPGPGPSHP